MGVPASQRLRKQGDFQEIRSQGKRIHCGSFIFQCLVRLDGAPKGLRLSVIASRRVGNAVKRNYGKRVFRELFRRHQEALPPECDVVIVLRSSFSSSDYQDLESRFVRACSNMMKHSRVVGEDIAE